MVNLIGNIIGNSIRSDVSLGGEVIPEFFTVTIDTTLGDGDLDFNIEATNLIGNIEWGDGTIDNNIVGGSRTFSHTYAAAGIYKITMPDDIEFFDAVDINTDSEKIIGIDLGNNYGINSTSQRTFLRDTVNCQGVFSGTGDFSTVNDCSQLAIDSGIAKFPANVFDNCPSTDYRFAFLRCNLDQKSVDNILTSINVARLAGVQSGTIRRIDINSGTNATPSLAVQGIVDDLRNAGWVVNLNGY